MRKCEICNSTYQVCFNKQTKQLLCSKHRYQIATWGKIKRTIYDPNEIIIYKNHAEILLYNKNSIEVGRAKIDIEDINKIKKFKWRLSEGYCITTFNKISIRLHTLLMNPPKNLEVDHRNRNKLDNRKQNLRICSRQENSFNQNPSRRNISGVRGIIWNKKTNKWRVRISYNGKEYSLGEFKDLKQAKKVRIKKEKELFKQFSIFYN